MKKIERLEFDQSIIEKNEERGIKDDKRFYYDCCLCCKESLEQIKNKKKLKEKKMNELKESSKENTSDNFCGAAFITFNTIKEQEDYLYKVNKSCCYRLCDACITLFQIYFYFLCPHCCCCCCCCCFCCCRGSCCYQGKYRNTLNFYNRKIRFERAPEPEDIIFENLEIGFKTKFKNIIYVCFISLLICFISSGINFVLYWAQSKSGDTIIFQVFSFSLTIISAVVDLVLEIVLEKLIKHQKSYTLTNFQANYSTFLPFY